jgi:hypothetical protein
MKHAHICDKSKLAYRIYVILIANKELNKKKRCELLYIDSKGMLVLLSTVALRYYS